MAAAILSNHKNSQSLHSFKILPSQMLCPFVCGNFNKEEDDQLSSSQCSSTRKRSRKNPYSSRGLDKFSALVADLEEKRQKICSQLGSDDVYFVRFAYLNENDFKPIVIKLKDKEKDKITEIKESKERLNVSSTKSGVLDNKATIDPPVGIVKDVKQVGTLSSNTDNKKFSWNISFGWWRRPHFYLPMVFILTLLLLAAFGRSAAILSISIAWYVIPTLQESSQSQVRLSMNNREYARRLAEKNMVYDGLASPKKSSAAVNDKSP